MCPQEPQPSDPAPIVRLHLTERVDPEAAAALWSLIFNEGDRSPSEPDEGSAR